MSTKNDDIEQKEYTQAELKQEANELFNFYRENPHDIKVEESEYYFHPSDYNDIRQPIAFVGEYAYIAALLTEFWCPRAVRPIPINIKPSAAPSQCTTQLEQVVVFEKGLQAAELAAYKEKLLSSPLSVNTSEEQIQEKIDELMAHGDISHLAVNSNALSTGTTFKLATVAGVGEVGGVIAGLKKLQPTAGEESPQVTVQDKPLLIIVLDTNTEVQAYQNGTITTLAPAVVLKGEVEVDVAELSTFVQGLPDVLAMFL